ncbi:MAG: membrane-bound PQQ-dependent dehydrogenase, glucose/quinate/shikimate family [Gammaproteobacteria bacterium]|nr:membrane-bound PQQ-dependent dehydrogenase, glucose/quinate/shikimate family [Gammaproteobacteria bacterium]|tara:strand:- start:123 stop:2501 length:2379 start_codon:yes stop_codon:yes gene_type:complete
MTESVHAHPRPRVLGVLLVILGLAPLAGGGMLLAAGGTWYYLAAGVALVAAGYFTFRGRTVGASIYGWLLLATVAWALFEVGLDGWGLVARLAFLAVLGLWFLLPRTRRGLHQAAAPALIRDGATRGIVAGIVLTVAVLLLADQGGVSGPPPSAAGTGTVDPSGAEWAHYGATKGGTRYAPHDQIDRDNVHRLEQAWVYRTGVGGAFKATPLQVGDALYLCTGQNVVIALDAETGAERWRHDPEIDTPKFAFWDTCRGVTYYDARAGQAAPAACPERIYTATTDARLIALDARSGELCEDFGEDGEISLLPGMGEVKPGFYYVTSPPTMARDTLVLGGWVADNQETGEPSGVVRGFDPVTGALKWAWDLGNEARSELPPAGQTYTRGTPNVWSLTSADDELGLVYVPTGNATPDYFGGHRSEAMEKYASSVVALDAATGRARWHFQTTHHDIWDYDVPSQPTLVDVPVDGVVRKAVLVPTKRGQLFMLDRATGEPLADVVERPVPQTDVDGEWTTPTQPFSVGLPSFDRNPLRGADMWGITPLDHMACRLRFQGLRYDGPLTPPSLEGTLLNPGVAGGMNWGSIAVDEANRLAVVGVIHMPMTVKLIPRGDVTEGTQFGIGGPQAGTPYAAYVVPFFSPLFAPCLSPPYGELAVIDLATRELVWRRPIGTSRGWGPLGIKLPLSLPMGMFIRAGTVVTGGGLIFTAGVADRRLRAFDVLTGEELLTRDIPTTSEATPMSYVSPASGRQTLLVTLPDSGELTLAHDDAAAEEGAAGERGGGYVIAYRLPDNAE